MGTSQLQGGLMITLSYILPAFSFLFICFQPGAVQLYFFTSVMLAFAQGRLLTNNVFRKFLGLHLVAPKPKKPDSSGSTSNSISTNIPAFGPGGLKLYQPPRQTPAVPNERNVSVIDKIVDRAKERKKEAVDGWYDMLGTTKEKKIKQRQQEKIREQAERYEKRMAMEDEIRRAKSRLKTNIASKSGGEKTGTYEDVRRGRSRERL
jgi:YidC/Oxa1 family membrane protein insertase